MKEGESEREGGSESEFINLNAVHHLTTSPISTPHLSPVRPHLDTLPPLITFSSLPFTSFSPQLLLITLSILIQYTTILSTSPSSPSTSFFPSVREEDLQIVFEDAGVVLRNPEVQALADRFAVGDKGTYVRTYSGRKVRVFNTEFSIERPLLCVEDLSSLTSSLITFFFS